MSGTINAPHSRSTGYLISLIALFVVSRVTLYFIGIRFDAEPLQFYGQYADPFLLRHDFWRTILHYEQQPPLYNMYLGLMLHLFPSDATVGFAATYLVLGLILFLCLFALMQSMGVDRRIALVITAVVILSPETILYENLLFYEYVLATLFCAAALFLKRYATTGRAFDGTVFFWCLALLAGIRAIYHLAWFVLLVGVIVYALPQYRRRTMLVAAIPLTLLSCVYLKNFVYFHSAIPGADVQGGMNFAVMSAVTAPKSILQPLIDSRAISPILASGECTSDVRRAGISNIVPRPAPAGVPVLDDCVKTTGVLNLNCRWLEDVGKTCGHDGRILFTRYPRRYLRTLIANVNNYFAPTTEGWPFDGRMSGANWQILSVPLRTFTFLTSGEYVSRRPWLHYLAFPALLMFGLTKAKRPASELLRGRASLDPRALTLLFIVFNIVYVSALVILLSAGDQNRYRFEIGSYYTVLLGLLLTRIHQHR